MNRQKEITLRRTIGPLAGFTVVAGSMLGVGIFLFPPAIAAEVNSLGLFFLVWIMGGVFAFSGSTACGELGAMLPHAGGDYVFQREAFGHSTAFAAGWVLFGAIFCGSIAGLSVALFQYQISALVNYDLMAPVSHSIPIPMANLLATALIVLLTIVNDAGTRIAARLQIVFTLLPVMLLLLLGLFALAFNPSTELVTPRLRPQSFSFQGLITAFLYVNFAYSGWLNIIYVAGEVKNPGRNIPKAMFRATFAITLLYCLLCAAFVFTMGYDNLASLHHTDAGTGMARYLNSSLLAILVPVTIAIAVVTSLNASILTGSRVAFAMAQDKAFWSGAAKLSHRNNVPRRALWTQAGISIILVLTGSFHAIIEMASIAMFVTGSLTVLSLFVLRHKKPDAVRPYLATGYPWVPGIYLLLSTIALMGTINQAFGADGMNGFYPFLGVGILVVAFWGHRIYHKGKRLTSN
ncbi:APC family permease [Alkaliflexus imshenetskii]|uniref:APC family permease n=1 Tax=Alkaliflexus imshenetskii TaxID=286730 RepID=UPI00047C5C9F|nr:amino acid permease [Alkaliflexus imshenetskii]